MAAVRPASTYAMSLTGALWRQVGQCTCRIACHHSAFTYDESAGSSCMISACQSPSLSIKVCGYATHFKVALHEPRLPIILYDYLPQCAQHMLRATPVYQCCKIQCVKAWSRIADNDHLASCEGLHRLLHRSVPVLSENRPGALEQHALRAPCGT